MTPPVIETERLRLRGPAAADLPAFTAFYASDRSRFVGGPEDERAAWRRFAGLIGHWSLRGFGLWTVTLKDDGAALGVLGCWFPAGKPEREVMWMAFPEGEGRGIAFEGAQAALRHAFGPLGWVTAVSYIAPDNARSIALARRLGATHDPAAAAPENPGHPPLHVYRHPAPETAP